MPDDVIPANGYLEQILAIVEVDEFEAETPHGALLKDSADNTDFRRGSPQWGDSVKAIHNSGKLPNNAK
jgi:hypothetical protein